MQVEKKTKLLHTFLTFLIISLIGNACADFALIWYSIGKMSEALGKHDSSALLSSFYVGQAIGGIVFAPILSAIVDRYSKRRTSIALDLTYAGFLLILLVVHKVIGLGPFVLFPFAIVTAVLGSLHRNAIGFGALKSLSAELGVTSIVAKFSASLYFTNVVGSIVSGFFFQWMGLEGCLFLAMATFIPMPFIYLKLFSKAAVEEKPARRHLFKEVAEGMSHLWNDRYLRWTTLSIAIVNFASNIYPALVGIAFEHYYPGQTALASIGVSSAIFVGVFSFRPLEKLVPNMSIQRILPISMLIPILTALVCMWYPNPIVFSIAFACQCCGAALVNIMMGSLRVNRVPSHLIGRVNTAFMAVVYSGQMVGGLTLIPLMESNLRLGALAIAVCFTIASVLSLVALPAKNFKELLEEKAC